MSKEAKSRENISLLGYNIIRRFWCSPDQVLPLRFRVVPDEVMRIHDPHLFPVQQFVAVPRMLVPDVE